MKKPSLAIMIGGLKPSKETASKHGLKVDESEPASVESDEDDMGLETAAEELLSAIEEKDVKLVAEAFKTMFLMCESYPHEEAE